MTIWRFKVTGHFVISGDRLKKRLKKDACNEPLKPLNQNWFWCPKIKWFRKEKCPFFSKNECQGYEEMCNGLL